MGFITQEGLENLKKYKYVSGGYSKVDNIMNHWWEFCIKLMPMVNTIRLMLTIIVEYRAKYDYSGWVDCKYPGRTDLSPP